MFSMLITMLSTPSLNYHVYGRKVVDNGGALCSNDDLIRDVILWYLCFLLRHINYDSIITISCTFKVKLPTTTLLLCMKCWFWARMDLVLQCHCCFNRPSLILVHIWASFKVQDHYDEKTFGQPCLLSTRQGTLCASRCAEIHLSLSKIYQNCVRFVLNF